MAALPALRNRWAVLALLSFVRTCMAMQFYTVPPLVPFLVAELDVNYTRVGALIGLFMMPGVVLALPGGLLGTRFGDRRLLLSALALLVAGGLAFAAAQTFALAFSARLLAGVGAALLTVQLSKVVTDWFAGREIALAMGVVVATWPLGNAIALGSLGAVAQALGWRAASLLPVALTALALLAVLALFRGRGPEAPPAGGDRPPLWVLSRGELALVLVAGLGWVCLNGSVVLFHSFTPSLFLEWGASVALAGLMVSIASWIATVWSPLAGFATDKVRHPDRLVVLPAILAAGILAALSTGVWPLLWITVFAFFGATPAGGIMSLPSQALRAQSRSTGFGVFFTVFYLGQTLFPVVGGALQDATGTAASPVRMSAALYLAVPLMLGAFRLLQRRLQTRTPATA